MKRAPLRFLLPVVIAAFAICIAVRLQPNILGDDAAITMRYASRFATGHGLTYNDHERVLGASNPLYALMLGTFAAAGTDVEFLVRVLAPILLTSTAILAAALAVRFSGSLAGAVAGLVLPLIWFFRYHMTAGMETGLAMCLALASLLSLTYGLEVWSGVWLGLAIWNKLDAGLLAFAIVAAVAAIQRRVPMRMLSAATAVLLPWIVGASWYYGSPVPHSLVVKLAAGASGAPFDRNWVLRFLARDVGWMLVALAGMAWLPLRRQPAEVRTTALALAIWCVLHAVMASFVNLGDLYPWYLTAIVPPIAVLALASVAFAASAGDARVAALAWLVLVFALWPGVRATSLDVKSGNPLKEGEAFDADRRLAGLFIRQFAAPHEITESDYGWPAFEVAGPFNDDSGLNSRRSAGVAQYRVVAGSPYNHGSVPPEAPDGYLPLATFNLASHLRPGYSWFVVYGRPDSQIARTGARYLVYRLFELPPPIARSMMQGLDGVERVMDDLVVPATSGATFEVAAFDQPVTIVFTPTVEPRVRDGVVFEVWSGDELMFSTSIRVNQPSGPISVPIRAHDGRVRFSLSTRGDSGERGRAAAWRDVSVIVGSCAPDLKKLRSAAIATLWQYYNPTPVAR